MSMFKESSSYVDKNKWANVGSITVQQAALTATGRTDAVVEALATANKAIYYTKTRSPALEFRFRSDSDDDTATNTLQLYASNGVDHYTRISQLVIKEGLQEYSSTIFFADGIAVTLENWITDTKAVVPITTDDHIARYVLNTHGYDRFLFIASTRNSTTVYIDVHRI